MPPFSCVENKSWPQSVLAPESQIHPRLFDSDQILSIDISSDNRLVFACGHYASDVVLIKNAKE